MTTVAPTDSTDEFRALLERHADRLDLDLIDRALRVSAAAHLGQKRRSGEDFVSHSIAVAQILVDQQLDSTSVVAALLHDVVEDSEVRLEDITRDFGAEVGAIVDGLTKISHLTFRSSAEAQVENYRKLLLSVAKDARVIIIKLADRLHNMRTLDWLSPEKRQRIALETREIYAPLAHRFGMAGVKTELEDLAFKHLEPEDYAALIEQVQAMSTTREATVLKLKTPLEFELQKASIADFEVAGRVKHLWSIFQKMKKREKPFDEIYDLMAVRVTVPHGHGLLPRPRRHPPQLDPDPGADQGLHRLPQVQRVPVAPHDHLRPRRPDVRGPDPYPRDAPHRRARHRGALGVQGEGGRRARRARRPLRVVPPAHRAAAGRARPRGVPRVPQDRPVSRRDLRLHPPGGT